MSPRLYIQTVRCRIRWRTRSHLAALRQSTVRSRTATMAFSVKIKRWHAVAAWTWNVGDEVCTICHNQYDGCPEDSKYPGDDSAVILGACDHAFHLQCINKWLAGSSSEGVCPLCRRPWEYKSAAGGRAQQPEQPAEPGNAQQAAHDSSQENTPGEDMEGEDYGEEGYAEDGGLDTDMGSGQLSGGTPGSEADIGITPQRLFMGPGAGDQPMGTP